MKICCDAGETDLTDFFDKWGFFWVGELKLKDSSTQALLGPAGENAGDITYQYVVMPMRLS